MPKKILQITNKPAYPSIDGGCLGMAKMSGFYDSNPDFNLDILTLETFKHPFNQEEFNKNLSSDVKVFSVKIKTKPTVSGAVKALLTNESYNLSRFKSKELEKKLSQILNENNYDFIQLENIFVAQYIDLIRQCTNAKIILNSANIEHEIWERMSCKSSWPKNYYFQILARQLKNEEKEIWRKVDGIICATKKDEKTISNNINTSNIITLPFYLDITKYHPIETTNSNLSFFHLGAMDWLPNIEGLNWFISNIWSKVTNKPHLNIAGKDMPDSFFDMQESSIMVSGFVPNAIEFMQKQDVMVVPLLSGSGIRVKIIEAMALGKCVISTSVGAEGINFTHNQNIWIANTEKEFIKAIEHLNKHPEISNQIGKESRKLIEKEHDISLMGNKLIKFLHQIN